MPRRDHNSLLFNILCLGEPKMEQSTNNICTVMMFTSSVNFATSIHKVLALTMNKNTINV